MEDKNHILFFLLRINLYFKINFYTDIFNYSTNVVMNYTEIEGKVREATNDDPWGPTGPLMQELAHATFSYETFPEVMSMLWKRMLTDNKTNWRRTYKVFFYIFIIGIQNQNKLYIL